MKVDTVLFVENRNASTALHVVDAEATAHGDLVVKLDADSKSKLSEISGFPVHKVYVVVESFSFFLIAERRNAVNGNQLHYEENSSFFDIVNEGDAKTLCYEAGVCLDEPTVIVS